MNMMLQAEKNEYEDYLRFIGDSDRDIEVLDDDTLLFVAQMKHQSMRKRDSEGYFSESISPDNDMFETLQSMVLGRMAGEHCTPENMQEIGAFVCKMAAEYMRSTCQADFEKLDIIEPDLYDDTAACTQHMDDMRLAA